MSFCRYGEEPDYPYNNPPKTYQEFYAGKKIGHFTQVCFFLIYSSRLVMFPLYVGKKQMNVSTKVTKTKEMPCFSPTFGWNISLFSH